MNIKFFDKQEKKNQIKTLGNNKPNIYKVNPLNNFFNKNNTSESNKQNNNKNNDINHLSAAKLKTEADKINVKFKINPEIVNNNFKINPSTERNSNLKDTTERNHSSTIRAKNSNSFREFVIKLLFSVN